MRMELGGEGGRGWVGIYMQFCRWKLPDRELGGEIAVLRRQSSGGGSFEFWRGAKLQQAGERRPCRKQLDCGVQSLMGTI